MNPQFTIISQRGVGLIELLVSMFIGLLIMAGVVQMVGTTSQNAVNTSGISRIQENTRFAFTRIEEDLMRAGSSGCLNTSLGYQMAKFLHNDTNPRNLPANSRKIVDSLLTSPDGTDRNALYDFNNIIGGVDGANAAPDDFLVRLTDQSSRVRVDSFTNGVGNLTLTGNLNIPNERVVVVGNCERSVALIANASDGNQVAWDIATSIDEQTNASVSLGLPNSSSAELQSSALYLYAGATGAYRYFIDTSASAQDGEVCNQNAANIRFCALFRSANGVAEELVEGVHNMQITYGYYQGGVLSFATATEIGNVDDIWNAVDRVRIVLSFNSVDPVITQGNTAGADDLLSRTFTRTISLFNQI